MKEWLFKKQEKTAQNNLAQQRVNLILNGLERGLSIDEIDVKLATLPKTPEDAKSRNSVDGVKRALEDLPFVEKIEETIPGKKQDTFHKRDLIITLNGDHVPKVYLQVKSSLRREIGLRNRIRHNYQKSREVLNQRKLVIVNGQIPEDAIRQIFLYRLGEIDTYHKDSHRSSL